MDGWKERERSEPSEPGARARRRDSTGARADASAWPRRTAHRLSPRSLNLLFSTRAPRAPGTRSPIISPLYLRQRPLVRLLPRRFEGRDLAVGLGAGLLEAVGLGCEVMGEGEGRGRLSAPRGGK